MQLKIKNVGVGDPLRPHTVWFGGTPAFHLIKDPPRLTLTNTMKFQRRPARQTAGRGRPRVRRVPRMRARRNP